MLCKSESLWSLTGLCQWHSVHRSCSMPQFSKYLVYIHILAVHGSYNRPIVVFLCINKILQNRRRTSHCFYNVALQNVRYYWFQYPGISALTNIKVNPYQPTSFTCTVQGDPLPEEDSVHLSRLSHVGLISTDIHRNSSTADDSGRSVLFTVPGVIPGDYYRCALGAGFTYVIVPADTYGEYSIIAIYAACIRMTHLLVY